MRVFSPTKGIRLKVHKVMPVTYVVYDEETAKKVREVAPCEVCKIPDCAPHERLSYKRDWIQEQVGDNWVVMVDDNVERISGLSPDFDAERIDYGFMTAKEWWQEFDYTYDWRYVADILIAKCEEIGCPYGGISRFDNPFWRIRKWRNIASVRTKFCVLKPNGLKFHAFPEAGYKEDDVYSMQILLKYGKIVYNNHFFPVHVSLEAGGIGTMEYRIPFYRAQAIRCAQEWPELVEVQEDGWNWRFKVRSLKQLEKIREDYRLQQRL